jgi:hypothetical protein
VTAVVTEAADAERVLSPRKDTPANDVVTNDDDMALISYIRCFFENVQQTYFTKRRRTRPTKLLQSFSETYSRRVQVRDEQNTEKETKTESYSQADQGPKRPCTVANSKESDACRLSGGGGELVKLKTLDYDFTTFSQSKLEHTSRCATRVVLE